MKNTDWDAPAFSTAIGLTKREYFTAIVLNGLLAHGYEPDGWEDAPKDAVIMADLTIDELNKEKQ